MNEHFITQLREHSFFFKLESKSRFGGGVSVKDIIDVLKNLSYSYAKYIEIEYTKVNTQMDKRRFNKILSKLKEENSLIVVDLKFESCGMSVAPNVITSNAKIPNTNGAEWKREAFQQYQSMIIESRYNDKEYLKVIEDKYSPQERYDIFKPIIEGIVNNKNATVKFRNNTNSKLHEIGKPPKDVLQILLPAIKEVSAEVETTTTLAKVEVVSGKPRIKPRVLELFSNEVAPKLTFESIKYESNVHHLKIPIVCDVMIKDGVYILENSQFGIYAYGESLNEAKRNFEEDFDYIVYRYSNTNNNDLTPMALEIKNILQFIIK